MEAHKDNFDALVEDFLGKYENHRAAQQAKLGELFRASDYPSVEMVREKFKFRVSYQVIPMATSGTACSTVSSWRSA